MLSADGGRIEPFRVRFRTRLMENSKSEFNKSDICARYCFNLVSFVRPETVIKDLSRK